MKLLNTLRPVGLAALSKKLGPKKSAERKMPEETEDRTADDLEGPAPAARTKPGRAGVKPAAALPDWKALFSTTHPLNPMQGINADVLRRMTMEMVAKALFKLDQATLIIVSVCWGAALLVMGLAIYTVNQASLARQESEQSRAAQILLPQQVRTPIARENMQAIAERVLLRYPDILISVTPEGLLQIATPTPDFFADWLNAAMYPDTIAADHRWSVSQMCVGKSCGANILSVTLSAERITFAAPSGG